MRAASFGWIATPAITDGQRSAACTAQRQPSGSQPICTILVTPTSAASRMASSGSRPDLACVESRWQCESTTGAGSGSGSVRQLHAPTVASPGFASSVGHFGLETRPSEAVSVAFSGRARRERSSPSPAAAPPAPPPPSASSRRRPGRAPPQLPPADLQPAGSRPPTTRVTSPRTSDAAHSASSCSDPRRTSS